MRAAKLESAAKAQAALREAIDAARDEASSEDAAARVSRLKAVINGLDSSDPEIDAAVLKEARLLRDRLVEEARTAKKKGKAATKAEAAAAKAAAKAAEASRLEAEAAARSLARTRRGPRYPRWTL